MLNLSLGAAVEFDGRAFIETFPGAQGHVIFGPYMLVEPGQYLVEFEIGLADAPEPDHDRVGALIDVVADHGQTIVAFDFVMLSRLGAEPQRVRLAFDLAESRQLEFRLCTLGHARLLVGDEPQLSRRPESEAIQPRHPDRHENTLKELFLRNVPLCIIGDDVRVSAPRASIGDLFGLSGSAEDDLARQIANTIAFKGDHSNALYRAFVGTDQPAVVPPQPVPFSSTLCQQAHFGYDQYRYWARALKETPKFYRKQWEFVFIAQALFERGFLSAGKRGLVFGAGQEPLPALFASFGVEILATDQAADQAEASGWTRTGQHTFDLSALNQRGICTDRLFQELVSFQPADMNDIPAAFDGQFDFCWSACALEHLGSLEHGLSFIENSMRTLRPGGIAIHTTEYNLSSNDDTLESQFCSFYRRRDIEDLVVRLERRGLQVAPIDWQIGEGFAERVADFPPYGRGEPHIRLHSDRYEVTSIGLIIHRP